VSQLQLAQPVLTLVWSALLLGESVGPATIAASVGVVGAVALTQRASRRSRRAVPATDIATG
jgi:drug/metabolite transporter (DMT)-like permease